MSEPRFHTFGPIEKTGLLAALTLRQAIAGLITLALSFVMLVALPPLLGFPLALLFAAVGYYASTKRVYGRPAVEWTDTALRHWLRRLTGANRYKSAAPTEGFVQKLLSGEAPETQLCLPPELQDLEILGFLYHGQEAGVVYDSREKTYAATISVGTTSFSLLDHDEQQMKLEAWAEVLGHLCRENSPVGRIQWIERTLPARQDRLLTYLKENGSGMSADAPAMRSYLTLLEQAGEVQQQHQLLITMRVDASRRVARKTAAKLGKGHEGYCALLMRELDAFARALGRVAITVDGVLRPRHLAEVIRLSYDPFAARVEGGGGVAPTAAGPATAESRWDTYEADGTLHTTYWISEWPRVAVGPDFLSPLLIGGGTTRTVGVTIEPVPTAKALDDAEHAVTSEAADEEFRQRKQIRTTMRRRKIQQAVATREEELAAGWAEVRFAGFVTVSARSESELDSSCAEIEHAASQSRIVLRRMDGEHGEALTYTMPLGRGLAGGIL